MYFTVGSESEKVILLHYMTRKISVELVLEITYGTSLEVQWLRLVFSLQGTSLIPGWGTRKKKERTYLYSLAQLFFLSS